MRVDGRLDAALPAAVAASARAQESEGHHTLWTSETAHDPFLPLYVAAEHTEQVRIGCAIAVAFARSPMTLAHTAHDLQAASGGRFVLGLGTQVRAHIERRFSMPWNDPLPRMAEFVDATRTILRSWDERESPRFEGKYYQHTLATPFFTPKPHGYGVPPILLAAVGIGMARLAGRIADGVFVHSFMTRRYLVERFVPAVEEGRRLAGRESAPFELNCRGFLVTGRDEEELERAKAATRMQIAFYGSTPTYRPVLELHGWGELADRLHTLSVSGSDDRWQRMGELIDDDILDEFAVVGQPSDVADQVRERFDGVADAFRFYAPYAVDPQLIAGIARELAAVSARHESKGSDDASRR